MHAEGKMSITAPTLTDVVDRIDALTGSLSSEKLAHETVASAAEGTHVLLRSMRTWVGEVSVTDSDVPYIASFKDSLWWGDAMLQRIRGGMTEDSIRVRLICQVLEELRGAVVMLRRDLSKH
jgi:hypothetical protein